MLKAFKYELRPNKTQQKQLAQIFGNVRFVYNWALGEKIKAYRQTGKSPSAFKLCNLLTKLKKEKEWLKEAPIHSLQKSIFNLNSAYLNFFNKITKYPKFKSKHDNKQSFSITSSIEIKINFDKYKVKIPKVKWIEFYKDRHFDGEIRQATVSKTLTNRYYISVLVEDGNELPNKKKIKEKTTVGIDLGVKDFVILSDAQKIANPKLLDKQLQKLRREQRSLQRKQKGSNRRNKQRLLVAKLHEYIANQRKDFTQKLSTAITKQYDTICVEDLNVKGMMQNRCLSKAIGQLGWGMFKAQLKYKCDWHGKNFIEIDRFEPSSKTCSNCGTVNQELKLADRFWTCEICGTKHDRDVNAAINIKYVGLRTQPSGANSCQ